MSKMIVLMPIIYLIMFLPDKVIYYKYICNYDK